jgi:hypothetical protein
MEDELGGAHGTYMAEIHVHFQRETSRKETTWKALGRIISKLTFNTVWKCRDCNQLVALCLSQMSRFTYR